MASGDTKLSICSDALIMLGASPLSSFSDGTDEAQVADRLYDDVRDTLLMQYPYSWTLKKVQLAQLLDTPINEWKYKYQLPGDRLGLPRFMQAAYTLIWKRFMLITSIGQSLPTSHHTLCAC